MGKAELDWVQLHNAAVPIPLLIEFRAVVYTLCRIAQDDLELTITVRYVREDNRVLELVSLEDVLVELCTDQPTTTEEAASLIFLVLFTFLGCQNGDLEVVVEGAAESHGPVKVTIGYITYGGRK